MSGMPELRALAGRLFLRQGFVLSFAVIFVMLATSTSSHAAQALLQASPERLLTIVEGKLSEHQLSIIEQAETDRFALIYAQNQNGGHVTITIRQMPADADRSRVGVQSDSPQNPNFDRTLLNTLETALETEVE